MIVGLIGFAAQAALPPESDVSWLLAIGRRMNAGEVLYSRDLVEINLPLIMQMSAIVVGVGDWLRIDALSLWRVTVGLLVVGGFTVSWRLLRSVLVEIPRETQAALALFFVAALVSLPGISFGQREHLVVLGFLPYIVGAGVRAHGRPLPSATAVPPMRPRFAA